MTKTATQKEVDWIREYYDGPKQSMTCRVCGQQVALGWLKRHTRICAYAIYLSTLSDDVESAERNVAELALEEIMSE